MERNNAIGLATLIVVLTLGGGTAGAVQRTFVASTGLDTNPCSLTQPCRSFAAAIPLTNNGGDIVTLDSAGYGPVVIDKPVSILVPSGVYAGVSVNGAQVDGIVVDIPGGGGPVYMRGLQISGQGGTNGVRIQQGGKVIIENTSIANFFASGNGRAILDNSTSPYTELIVRNTVIRDSDAGIVVDGTTGGKPVTIENSFITGIFNAPCVALTDNVNMVVRDTTVSDCNTGFSITQPAASTGYIQLQMERTTLSRIGPGAAVNVQNNATDRAPRVSISDSHVFDTSGIGVTNGANVAIDRSTIEGCGTNSTACIDVGGAAGYTQVDVTKSEIRRSPGGIRMDLGGGTMGGSLNVVDSRITQIYPNEAIYLRGNPSGQPLLVAKGSSIANNNKGIVVDSYAQAHLTTNQIVFNNGGGLIKVPAGTNQYIESSNDNYVTANGGVDATPVTIMLR